MRDFKDLKIAVAGTGYVGLSIATLLAQHHTLSFTALCISFLCVFHSPAQSRWKISLVYTFSWVRWSIVRFALRTNCWTNRASRAMPLSTTLTVKLPGPVSSSTNGSSLVRMKMATTCRRQSSVVSIAVSGNRVMSLTIL